MSFCPACGNPVSDPAARFCAKCGRELPAAPPPPAAPPTPPPTPTYAAPPPPVPPPAYAPTATYPGAGPAYPPPTPPAPAPAPVQPSPAAQFVRRVFAGRWDGALLAAVVPALVLLVLAGVLGTWSQHAFRGSAVSWFKRSRIALTLAVQGLGGHVSVDARDTAFGSGDSDCSDYYDDSPDSYDDGPDSYDGDYSDACSSDAGSASLSVLPLTFTVLWVVALVLVLRQVRRRPGGAGPEAAVRVALLSAAAATVLAFVAQPSIEGRTLHSGPFRVLLWSFVISLVTALAVLYGPALRARFAAAWRVVGAASVALAVTVLFASAVVLVIALANMDNGVNGNALVVLGVVLPNLGLSALALGWGAPLRFHETSAGGRDYHHQPFGLSQLSHIWHGWSTVLALLGGLLCALAIGVIASARSRERSEQFAVAGVFTVMFAALVTVGGIASGGSSVADAVGGGLGSAGSSVGSAMPESLLFAALWSAGGVLLAPYVRRALGMAPPGAAAGQVPPQPSPYGYAPPYPYPAPSPYVPQQAPPQPQEVHDLGVVQPDRLAKDDDRTRRDEGGGRHQ